MVHQAKITEMFGGTPKTAIKNDKQAIDSQDCHTSSVVRWIPTQKGTGHSSQEAPVEFPRKLAEMCRSPNSDLNTSPTSSEEFQAYSDSASRQQLAAGSPAPVSAEKSARKGKLSLKRTPTADEPGGMATISGGYKYTASQRQEPKIDVLARKRDVIEEEETRVQERWEQEELVTLAQSRVPFSHSKISARFGDTPNHQDDIIEETDDEEEHRQQRLIRRIEKSGSAVSRQRVECIDLMESSQEQERAEAVCEAQPIDDEWDYHDGEVFVADGLRVENGVVVEDEPDEEELGVRN